MSETRVASLNKYQVNKSLRSKIKKSIPKPVLCTPFKITWPSVDSRIQEKVLSELTKFFVENDLKAARMKKDDLKAVRIKKDDLKAVRMKKDDLKAVRMEKGLSETQRDGLKELTKSEKKARQNELKRAIKQSTPYQLRECLALGINEVTRALENNIRMMKMGGDGAIGKEETKDTNTSMDEEGCMEVSDAKRPFNTSLSTNTNVHDNDDKNNVHHNDDKNNVHNDNDNNVHDNNNVHNDNDKNDDHHNNKNKNSKKVLSVLLVDRSSPWQLHRHLIQMSSISKCPSIAIDNLSDRISPLLSLTKLCALGFTRSYEEKEGVGELVDHISHTISSLCPSIQLPWMHFQARDDGGGSDCDGESEAGAEKKEGDDDNDGDDDSEEDGEMVDRGLNYEDIHIRRGVNDQHYEELFSLRKKVPLLEKKMVVMMFNYNPKNPSFTYLPSHYPSHHSSFSHSHTSSVFQTKAPDRRLKHFGDGNGDDVSMRQQLVASECLERTGAPKSVTAVTNRKRRFNDDVVMKVHKNTFKKAKTK